MEYSAPAENGSLVGKVLSSLPYLNETQAGEVAEALGEKIASRAGWLARMRENAMQEALAIENDPDGTATPEESGMPVPIRLRNLYAPIMREMAELEALAKLEVGKDARLILDEILMPALRKQGEDYDGLLHAATLIDFGSMENVLSSCGNRGLPPAMRGMLMDAFPDRDFPGRKDMVAEYQRVKRRLLKSGVKPPTPRRCFGQPPCARR